MPKPQHPENLVTSYCLLHRCGSCWCPPCFSSSSHSVSPSPSTLTKLRVSYSVLAKRSFSGVFLPKPLQWFLPGMMWLISTQPLARLGLGSRDHFGAPSEQCTTWPLGTCSFPSRSFIGPSSSLGGGRSWHQVILRIFYSKLNVCSLCASSHQLGISETERRRRKESNHFTTQITFVAWLLEVLHKTNRTNHYFYFLP